MRTARRALIAAAVAVAVVASQGGVESSASSASSVAAGSDGQMYQVRTVASGTVKPLIRWRWWGLEVRLTKDETAYVAGVGAAALDLTGIAPWLAWGLQSVIGGAALGAYTHNLCVGANVTVGATIPVVYHC